MDYSKLINASDEEDNITAFIAVYLGKFGNLEKKGSPYIDKLQGIYIVGTRRNKTRSKIHLLVFRLFRLCLKSESLIIPQ